MRTTPTMTVCSAGTTLPKKSSQSMTMTTTRPATVTVPKATTAPTVGTTPVMATTRAGTTAPTVGTTPVVAAVAGVPTPVVAAVAGVPTPVVARLLEPCQQHLRKAKGPKNREPSSARFSYPKI